MDWARRDPAGGWAGLRHLEGLFNPAGQQRGGMLYELLKTVPGRDRGHPVVDALSREAFNTNPVLAGYVTGGLAVELAREARELDPSEAGAAVERIRSALAPVVASVGDRIIWGGLRPALTLVGVLAAFFRFGEPALWYWLGYNSVQFYWRRRSWLVGSRGEAAVLEEFRGRRPERWAVALARLGRFLLGLTLGMAMTGLWTSQGAAMSLFWLLVCGLGFAIAAGGRIGPLAVGWIGIGAAAVVAGVRFALGRGMH